MRVGVDFGTTRTIVASVDRGNYPVVSFLDASGDAHDYFPSVVALDGDELCYGFEAIDAGERGAPMVRSFKRALASPEVSPETTIRIGGSDVRILDVMTGFFEALRAALESGSTVRAAGAPADPTPSRPCPRTPTGRSGSSPSRPSGAPGSRSAR